MATVSIGGGGLTSTQAAERLIPGGVYRSGQRLMMTISSAPIKSTAIVADTMYAFPIQIAAATTLASVAIQVGAPVAGVSAKLGLATTGPDGLPLTLLAEAPTPVDMNSAVDTELVASFSANVPVSAGFVWGLFVANGVAQPFTLATFNFHSAILSQLLGPVTMSGYTLQGGTGAMIRISRAHTYASAFPATLTGWARTAANPSSPIVVGVVA